MYLFAIYECITCVNNVWYLSANVCMFYINLHRNQARDVPLKQHNQLHPVASQHSNFVCPLRTYTPIWGQFAVYCCFDTSFYTSDFIYATNFIPSRKHPSNSESNFFNSVTQFYKLASQSRSYARIKLRDFWKL